MFIVLLARSLGCWRVTPDFSRIALGQWERSYSRSHPSLREAHTQWLVQVGGGGLGLCASVRDIPQEPWLNSFHSSHRRPSSWEFCGTQGYILSGPWFGLISDPGRPYKLRLVLPHHAIQRNVCCFLHGHNPSRSPLLMLSLLASLLPLALPSTGIMFPCFLPYQLPSVAAWSPMLGTPFQKGLPLFSCGECREQTHPAAVLGANFSGNSEPVTEHGGDSKTRPFLPSA